MFNSVVYMMILRALRKYNTNLEQKWKKCDSENEFENGYKSQNSHVM